METTIEQQLQIIKRNSEQMEKIGEEYKELIDTIVESDEVVLPTEIEEKFIEIADNMEAIGKSGNENVKMLMKRLSSMENITVN